MLKGQSIYIHIFSVVHLNKTSVCNNCHLTVLFSDHIHSNNTQLGCDALQIVLRLLTVWTFKHHTGSKPLLQRFHKLLPLQKEPQNVNLLQLLHLFTSSLRGFPLRINNVGVACSRERKYHGTNITVIYDSRGFECSHFHTYVFNQLSHYARVHEIESIKRAFFSCASKYIN